MLSNRASMTTRHPEGRRDAQGMIQASFNPFGSILHFAVAKGCIVRERSDLLRANCRSCANWPVDAKLPADAKGLADAEEPGRANSAGCAKSLADAEEPGRANSAGCAKSLADAEEPGRANS